MKNSPKHFAHFTGDEIANVNFLDDDVVHALQNTIDSCINSATDHHGYVLERRFTILREITQCNSHYAFQGHLRSPIVVQIKSSYTNLPLILAPFPSYGWLSVKFSLARAECLTLSLSLGVIPCQYRHKWYIAKKTRFFGLHFRCRRFWCIFNHFYVIRPESYRIQWNYAAVKATTPFKVIQGHRIWYRSKAHMRFPILVINTNLASVLHHLRDIAFDWSKIAIFGYPSCV